MVFAYVWQTRITCRLCPMVEAYAPSNLKEGGKVDQRKDPRVRGNLPYRNEAYEGNTVSSEYRKRGVYEERTVPEDSSIHSVKEGTEIP